MPRSAVAAVGLIKESGTQGVGIYIYSQGSDTVFPRTEVPLSIFKNSFHLHARV